MGCQEAGAKRKVGPFDTHLGHPSVARLKSGPPGRPTQALGDQIISSMASRCKVSPGKHLSESMPGTAFRMKRASSGIDSEVIGAIYLARHVGVDS